LGSIDKHAQIKVNRFTDIKVSFRYISISRFKGESKNCFDSTSNNLFLSILCIALFFTSLILNKSLFFFFKQNLNNVAAMRQRLAKYLIPVFIFSVAFNVPKFFESNIVYQAYQDTPTSANGYEHGLNVSKRFEKLKGPATKGLGRFQKCLGI